MIIKYNTGVQNHVQWERRKAEVKIMQRLLSFGERSKRGDETG